ncbi:MFS transporter [Nocardia sp. NPDC006630]|uniref:MFS transporter n=1 Tax=Nocardia sp. NPDC006630 TaxID=3157181 RepID=UPI0033A8ECCF
MAGTRSLGRQFELLWGAYAVSTLGTWFAFDAFSLIAIIVLHTGPTEVSVLAAAGLAVGALVAIPLGPWVEFRRKRPVMIAMDLVRFAAVLSIPVAFALGWLTYAQLLVVAIAVAASDIAFKAASGAYLKSLVPQEDLLIASSRFEATTWTVTMLAPPLGGLAIGMFGPMTTVLTNGVSFVLSALGIRAIGGSEAHPSGGTAPRLRLTDLAEGWRYILAHPTLRPLFFNSILVGGLIMATAPLMAVLMLGQLGFTPFQYGLAFGAPCLGGLLGARLARRFVTRFGQRRVLLVGGTLRACWSVGLAFVHSGTTGLVLVMAIQFGLVACMGVFNPVYVAYRMEQTESDRMARTLAAWSITSSATIAALTALCGVLAAVIGARETVLLAGVLMLATPLLLPRRMPVATPAIEQPVPQN